MAPASEEKDPVVPPTLEDCAAYLLDYPAAYPAFAEAARETEPATDSETLTQTLEGLGDTLI